MSAVEARDIFMQEPASSLEPGLPTSQPQAASLGPRIIEFPQRPGGIDIIDLNRDSFVGLPSGIEQREVLVALRRRDFDPAYVATAQEVFPEGEFLYPFSFKELQVFDVFRRMAREGYASTDRDGDILTRNGVLPQKAEPALKAVVEARRAGRLLTDDTAEVDGYKLGRELAFEIWKEVDDERTRDNIRRIHLEEVASFLADKDIAMEPVDQHELDRLTAKRDERERFLAEQRDQARYAGYNRDRIH